ncbi:TetR/AcrR family transcriptional regulator [Croceibacterium sp. LX-88]|uniref:TetR/AcrR family transcriptional regulator n=1 Tax=Croceibacterium selenioxidans TaxID=2838833 RepID=A0ABS5WAB7_9SPHN|nr:TetR/AcrR family transcriptional regulator [Croceibacterium selenioxidans]MBT2135354.1 TetR/AcrR family transcriptional regulator [Croceibacterium selenioxidans]
MGKGQGQPGKSAAKLASRGKGRPTASEAGVGRDALIDAARALLQELPPSQVTSTAIARKANADPALVRYYFGNRENLLFEVAKQIGEESNRPLPPGDPLALLEDMIRGTFRFTRSAKHMQRLMIEELDSASSPEVREKMREWNRSPVSNYARILEFDDEGELREFDPFFMYLAVVGISDFFVSGAPLIELLAPSGTTKEELAKSYEDFVVRLITDGVRKR